MIAEPVLLLESHDSTVMVFEAFKPYPNWYWEVFCLKLESVCVSLVDAPEQWEAEKANADSSIHLLRHIDFGATFQKRLLQTLLLPLPLPLTLILIPATIWKFPGRCVR